MLEFTFIFGAAALSLLVMNGLTGRKICSGAQFAAELLAFGLLDLGIACLILCPLQRMHILHSASGSVLDLGGLALLLMIPIAAAVGAAAAFIQQRISIRVHAELEETESETDEQAQ